MVASPVSGMRDDPQRVVLVSGAYPPDICGVGDYTMNLAQSAPRWWDLFVERDWSWRAAPGIVRRLLACRPVAVVVQYPTQGYGWSLVPHLLIAFGRLTGRYRPILALHEFSSLSHKARLTLGFASFFAGGIIFTTEEERQRARAYRLFSRRVPTSVIGILSNIPFVADPPPIRDRTVDVAYFGHIRPNKGLEIFLDTMAGMDLAEHRLRVVVAGVVPAGYEQFGQMIADRCRHIGCELMLGLDGDAVAALLGDVRCLYLPFPDGVSARRGSLLAGLGNGAIVATTMGSATPDALRPAIVPCSAGVGDMAVLQAVLALPQGKAAALQDAGFHYIATILPRDWRHVGELYQAAIDQAH